MLLLLSTRPWRKYSNTSDRILLGIFLCEHQPSPILTLLKPEWNTEIDQPLQDKLKRVEHFYPTNIFPWQDVLSDGIEGGTFSISFLIQPKLFLRIRPGKDLKVLKTLDEELIPYELVAEGCLAFDNGKKLHEILEFDNDVVVQDFNSQKVGELMELALENMDCPTCDVWDCCAASGGKSIMMYDLKPAVSLTVSDIRPSILHNLQQRFYKAGITNYQSFIADLRNFKEPNFNIGEKQYDLIICDAPCSGSGTWSRTPEQLFFFDIKELTRFSMLQKNIVSNVARHLKPNGQLLYVTCSVFKEENEEVVKFIQEKLHLKLVKQELYKGFSMQADTLFAALFQATS